METLKFRYQDPALVSLLVEKFQVSDKGLHRLTDKTDLKQIGNRVMNRLKDHGYSDCTIKRFRDAQTNEIKEVLSAFTNEDFDIVGFVKIVKPRQEDREEEVITLPFGFRGIKQQKLW